MRLLALMKKEFLQFWRDPALIAIVIWAFTLDVYFAGKGLTLDIRNFPVAVYDLSGSQASATLIEQLHKPRFRVVERINDQNRIDHLLDTGQVLMVIVIDKDFSEDLARGKPGQVQVLMDGTNSNSAAMALAYLSQIAARFEQPLRLSVGRSALSGRRGDQPVSARVRIWYNQNLNSTWFMGLSELFCVITMVAILLPAAAMVREKEYGTIEQLLVTPLHAWQIMLAKIIPMAVLIIVFTAVSVHVVLGWCFDFIPRGSLALFLVVTLIYVFTTAGLGMLIATAARNLSQIILMMLTAMVPIMFLSGTWTPPEAMTPSVRWITRISPLSYYLEIGYGIFFKGLGLAGIVEPLIWLILLGGVVFFFGATRVRRQLSS